MRTPTIARRFAKFACGLERLDPEVRTAADRAILDTLGVMLAGGAHPSVRALAQAAARGEGRATLATGGRADAEAAALVNGMAAHVWDFDDTSYTGIMHGSAVVLPAALGLAQELGSGADALRRAFVAGSEVAYALADLCTHAHYFGGWWSTITLGLAGATAAAGNLLELDEDAMTSALGLAAAAAGGGKVVLGTDAKPLLVGETARRAVTFARAAGAEMTGPEDAFENSNGYLKLLNRGEAREAELESIGRRWRLCDPGLLFKTSPVCSAALAAIEQMNALMAELGASADEVAGVHAEVPQLVYESLVFPNPATPQEMQFSLPYALACAALHGRVRFEDLAHSIVTPEKAALMARVSVKRAPDLSTDEMRAKYPESIRLTLTLINGRSATGFCGAARGMPERPLSDEELLDKFRAAGAYAGLSLPRVDIADFDPIKVFEDAVGVKRD
ncbi:MAG: MmgE/PrpD family protein [Nitrospinae bacterium]|nr:MmgE/PrpD family protein [Nitrospinota bacterium]